MIALLRNLVPVRLWTRPCHGRCGDRSGLHTHDLTRLGRFALGARHRS